MLRKTKPWGQPGYRRNGEMNTFLLGVVAFCAVVLTALALSAFLRFSRTLRLTHRLLDRFQVLFLRANRAAGYVEATVHRACDTAEVVLDDVEMARNRVASWIKIKRRKGETR